MFSKKVIINLQKKDDTIHIEPLGDVHVGHVGFIEDAYEQRIKDIAKDDNRYTLFMGDQLDAINIYDKRYNPEAVVYHDIDAQRQRWQDLSQPLIDEHLTRCEEIKFKQNVYNVKTEDFDKINRVKYVTKKGENPKVWGLLHGNHEYKIRKLKKT